MGRRTPPHCTAAGKVLLAYLPQDQVEQILPTTPECLTPQTVADRDELLQILAQARQRGYAIAQEELEAGLNAVAVPIFDHAGQVPAAACVSGPSYRVTPALFDALADQLMETAAEISRRLGYHPP